MENKGQAKQEPQAPQAQPEINVTGDDVRRFIPKALFELKKLLSEKRQKYGTRYNTKNKYEQALRRFNFDDAEMAAFEWIKIREKRSELPATVREVVREVGNVAAVLAAQDKQRALAKEKAPEHGDDDK